jgi:hypothetical protein
MPWLFSGGMEDTTNEEKKGLIEVGIEDREKKVVDWRTIERWRSGKTGVPNHKSFAALAAALGKGTEAMLRAARLMAVLREELGSWIGADAMAEWAGVVADVGRITARLLCDPGEVARLLRQICEDLEGPHGDVLHANLRSLLPALERTSHGPS